ncbi:MAG: ABC transporter substrate-binding protein [Nitrospinota bacterium]
MEVPRRNTLSWMVALFAAAAIGLVPALAGDARGAGLTPQEKKLIRAAKKEGAVTIINPLFSDRTAKRMGPAFIRRYGLGGGFKFNNIRKGTGATVATVRQEIKANKFTIDVHLVSAPGFFDAAAKRGAFVKLDSGYWKDHIELIKKAGQYSNYPYVVVPLAYTFQPIWNISCPGMKNIKVTKYADTVQAALKGKTISPDITKSFTYTNTTISLIESGINMNAFWDRLKGTNPIVEFRTEPKIQLVIACERPFDMWNLAGRVYQNVLKKPGLAKVLRIGYFKEGQVMLGNQAAVLKGSPHPNAGKLLIEFLLSKEGADIFVEGEAIYTFRKGYIAPPAARPYLLDLSKHKLLGLKDWVAAYRKFKATRGEWVKRFK